jgi:hypothetical protein
VEFTVTGTVATIVTTVGLSKADRPPPRAEHRVRPGGRARRGPRWPTVERIAALTDCDVLVFGHAYKPWVHDTASCRQLRIAAAA